MKILKTLNTWAGRSNFSYCGSVKTGTIIQFGKAGEVFVSAAAYKKLIKNFCGKEVNIGTSRDNALAGSVGRWLQENITKTAIASYVGPILIEEGYAEKAVGAYIKFY